MIGVLLAKFWPHALAGIALAALGTTMTQCSSLSKENAVLSAAIKVEEKCVAPSHCRQALTAYERDTAQAALTTVSDAANEAGKAADELRRRRAEIEDQATRERQRQARVLAETQQRLEEAIANDQKCKTWLDQPVDCPVTDPGELWTPDPIRGGFIDRGSRPAEDDVPASGAATDPAAVPSRGEADDQRGTETSL